jgi:hypothetical protein
VNPVNKDAIPHYRLASGLRDGLMTVAIWFEDLTQMPDRAERGVSPRRGMPEEWFRIIVGNATVHEVRYVEPHVLSGALIQLPAYNDQHAAIDHFSLQLRSVCAQLGTHPWLRNYDEEGYRDYWKSGKPLFPDNAPIQPPASPKISNWVVLTQRPGNEPDVKVSHGLKQALEQFFDQANAIARAECRTTYKLAGWHSSDQEGPLSLAFLDGDEFRVSLHPFHNAQRDESPRYEVSTHSGDLERTALHVLSHLRYPASEYGAEVPNIERQISIEQFNGSAEAHELADLLTKKTPPGFDAQDWRVAWEAMICLIDPTYRLGRPWAKAVTGIHDKQGQSA